VTKKKQRLSLLALTVVIIMLMGAVSGCGSPAANEAGGGQTDGTGGSSGETAGEAKKERYKISMMYPLYSDPPKKGEIWKLIEDKFNIEFEPMAIPDNSYGDKLKVTLASGDLPDLILWTAYPDPEFTKYVRQGAFLELDDWVTQYPNIMDTPEQIFDNIRIDGKLYGIPRTRALTRAAVMIRKDWLDNLGLPIPQTVDEVYETALKFTYDDPDQNGKDDTFGVVMGENLSHMDSLWMAFDTGNGWRLMEDGTLMNAEITPGRKQALEWLRNLYQEGGLDKDFAVLKNTQVWEKLEGGKGGIFLGGQTSDYARYVENLAKIDPNAELIMFHPPKGPTGKFGFGETSGFFGQWVIPANTEPKKVERIMELLNWQASEEGYEISRYGIEGIHHTKNADGTINLDAEKKKEEGSIIAHNPYDPYSYVVPTAPPEVQQAQKENLDMVATMGIKNPALSFLAPTAVEKQADLNKLRNEVFVQIVMGKLPLEEFDRFVEQWLDMGGRQITEEVNEWYKSQQQK